MRLSANKLVSLPEQRAGSKWLHAAEEISKNKTRDVLFPTEIVKCRMT